MKVNEAPEKVYCTPTEGGFYLTTIKPEPPFVEGVEYIRKDAFIEKVQSFLNKKDDRDFYTIGYIKRHLQEIIKEVGL